MKINASVLFYLLSKVYKLEYKKGSETGIAVSRVGFFNGNFSAYDIFIVNESGVEPKNAWSKKCAFIYCLKDGSEPPIGKIPDNTAYIISPCDSREVYEKIANILYSLQEWDCRMKDACVADSLNLNHLMEIAREVLDYSFSIVDRNLRNVAYSPDFFGKFKYFSPDPERVSEEAISDLLCDESSAQDALRSDTFFFPKEECADKFICRNILADEQFVARFQAILDNHEVTVGEYRLFEHIHGYFSKIFLKVADDTAIRRQNDKLHRCLHAVLVDDEPLTEDHVRIFNLYQLEMGYAYAIIVIQFIDSTNIDFRGQYVCGLLEETIPFSCAVFGDYRIVCAVRCDKSVKPGLLSKLKQQLVLCLHDQLCMAGISDIFVDPTDVKYFYLQAAEALRLGQKRDPNQWFFFFDDCMFEYIMENASGKLENRHVVHKGLFKLLEYDRKNDGFYAESLFRYIDCQFNASAAAEKCFVHRSTFIRRLERITELSGIDPYDSNEMIHVFISFKLLGIDNDSFG